MIGDAAGVGAATYIYVPGGAHTSITGPGGASQFDVTATLTGSWYILSQRCDGTHANHVLRGNGSDLTRGAVYASNNPGDQAAITLYAPAELVGDVAEILFYDSVLSGADLARVESYLNTKWAVY